MPISYSMGVGKNMKLGDLVDFHTYAWVMKHAEERYANPGLVIKINHRAAPSAVVYWADGKITTEHKSYLRPSKESDENQ